MATDKPTLAIIGGTGTLGSGLARRLAAAGYAVILGSRSAEKAGEAARASRARAPAWRRAAPATRRLPRLPMVIVTVPWESQARILDEIAAHVEGKLVVDTTVPLVPPRAGAQCSCRSIPRHWPPRSGWASACAWCRPSTTSPGTSCDG